MAKEGKKECSSKLIAFIEIHGNFYRPVSFRSDIHVYIEKTVKYFLSIS
jgi:hypothetical protein